LIVQSSKSVPSISAPRSIVVIGGYEVPFESWRVEQTGFEQADTFEVDLPFDITQEKGDVLLSNNPVSASSLITEPDIQVEIYRGVPNDPNNYTKNDLTQNMYGFVDTMDLYFDDTGEYLKLTGRSLAALLIDTVATDKFPNKTSSQIAQIFAHEHGLNPVITPTNTLAGTYYNDDSTVISNDSSEWDILQFLAQQEGFVARVKSNTLYFGPVEQVTDMNLSPIPLTWGDNIMELNIERSPQAARDLEVNVISYDRNHKKRIVGTAKSTANYSKKLFNQVNRDKYKETYMIPGLTQSQAQARAKSILNTLSAQQYIGTLKTYGDFNFSIDRRITLNGVGKVLSQIYYINRVTETFDFDKGFDVEIAFINQLLMPGGVN